MVAIEETTTPTPTPVPPTETPVAVVDTATPTETPIPEAQETPTPEPEADTPTPPPPTDTPATIISTEGNPDPDYAQVIYVKATQNSDGTWRFDTTVYHDDQGWDDYADAWQVVDPQTGEILAERILTHPHDNEQPFTRSQSSIVIPPEVIQVVVRAKDNVEGFGGQVVLVDLTVEQGENFEVARP